MSNGENLLLVGGKVAGNLLADSVESDREGMIEGN